MPSEHTIEMGDYWREGKIIEHFPDGRDRVLLPGECYRTNMEILHCASGGPVADNNGKVFGINSTGWSGANDSFVSRISSILDLAVPNSQLDTIKTPTVKMLFDRGFVRIE